MRKDGDDVGGNGDGDGNRKVTDVMVQDGGNCNGMG